MGSLIPVTTFQIQKSVSDVGQRKTSLTTVCATPISASIAGMQLWMLWPIVSRRLQSHKLGAVWMQSHSRGFDATSFSRGKVVIVAMGTGLEDFLVLLRISWYSSFFAPGISEKRLPDGDYCDFESYWFGFTCKKIKNPILSLLRCLLLRGWLIWGAGLIKFNSQCYGKHSKIGSNHRMKSTLFCWQ